VRIGDGPAAVTGDNGRTMSLIHTGWEDAIVWLIRKSEDLPEQRKRPHGQRIPDIFLWIKKGYPGSIFRSGIFFVLMLARAFNHLY
jgi:hypothetical protein